MDLVFQKTCTKQDFLKKDFIKVGIHGIHGSFTDEALSQLTHFLMISSEQYEVVELVESEIVLRSVENEEVDMGIFAFANSGSGGYVASVEAMGRHRYTLMALFRMPINMCILASPDVETIDEIEEFFGHPVAIAQSIKTLEARWPHIKISPATDQMDTALSAKLLAEGKIDKKKAVFASKRAAQIYGLKILAEGVHHDPNNATFFALVEKFSD